MTKPRVLVFKSIQWQLRLPPQRRLRSPPRLRRWEGALLRLRSEEEMGSSPVGGALGHHLPPMRYPPSNPLSCKATLCLHAMAPRALCWSFTGGSHRRARLLFRGPWQPWQLSHPRLSIL